jgi:hypothetical protein
MLLFILTRLLTWTVSPCQNARRGRTRIYVYCFNRFTLLLSIMHHRRFSFCERRSAVGRWNLFFAPSGIRQGLKQREEHDERQRLKQARASVFYVWAAGWEPAYRSFLADDRETISYIESGEHAIELLEALNDGNLTIDQLEELRRLSPSEVARRYSKMDPKVMANLYHVVGRLQVLLRRRDSILRDPIRLIAESHTEYYQSLPAGHPQYLRADQEWFLGDPNRPFDAQVFEDYRSQF